jgi:rhodanese-related sulfurtransferase
VDGSSDSPQAGSGTNSGTSSAAGPEGGGIAGMLAQAAAGLDRVAPEDLADEVTAGALVVDIRPQQNRDDEGLMPGAVVVDRNVLEWRLDPTSPDRLPESDDPDRRVVIFCNEGYASVLAAESLRRVGLHRATDLVGGYRAWRAAGLPTVPGGSPAIP